MGETMHRDQRLRTSLFALRVSVFLVMLMWTIDKLMRAEHAAAVFAAFYGLGGLGAGNLLFFAAWADARRGARPLPAARRRPPVDRLRRRRGHRALGLVALLSLGGCSAGDVSRFPGRGGATADQASPGLGAAPPPGSAVVDKHRGVSWVAGHEPVNAADFARLVDANVAWIAQTPFGWQRDERSPDLRLVTSGRVYWGETDEGLEVTARLARQHGIATLLKPHVWLTRPSEGVWRGDIGMDSDAEWALWFASYRRFALHYAELAERLEMPAFCIGTELHRTVRERPDDWRRLIAEIRGVYSGQLAYAANWNREVEEVPFWDALDLIGVQGYFPLATAAVPTVEELEAAWRPHVAKLEALAARHGRPVLFTEIGYVSRPGATAEPWLWPDRQGEKSEPAGLATQAQAYEAFFRVLWDRPWVAGAYFWKWYPNPAASGPAGADYTPQGKPAEEVLARWYGGRVGGRPDAGR
jgi:hypothetical protein